MHAGAEGVRFVAGGKDSGIPSKEQNMLLAPWASTSSRYRGQGLEPVHWSLASKAACLSEFQYGIACCESGSDRTPHFRPTCGGLATHAAEEVI